MAALNLFHRIGALSLPNLSLHQSRHNCIFRDNWRQKITKPTKKYFISLFFLSVSNRPSRKTVCIYLFELAFFLVISYPKFIACERVYQVICSFISIQILFLLTGSYILVHVWEIVVNLRQKSYIFKYFYISMLFIVFFFLWFGFTYL